MIQFESKIGESSYNSTHALALLKEAAEHGASMICLPEMFSTGYNLETFGDRIYDMAETKNGPTLSALKQFAAHHRVYIMASIAYYHNEVKGKSYIGAFFIDNAGILLGEYYKNNLFGLEKEYFSLGETYDVFDTKFGKIGIML